MAPATAIGPRCRYPDTRKGRMVCTRSTAVSGSSPILPRRRTTSSKVWLRSRGYSSSAHLELEKGREWNGLRFCRGSMRGSAAGLRCDGALIKLCAVSQIGTVCELVAHAKNPFGLRCFSPPSSRSSTSSASDPDSFPLCTPTSLLLPFSRACSGRTCLNSQRVRAPHSVAHWTVTACESEVANHSVTSRSLPQKGRLRFSTRGRFCTAAPRRIAGYRRRRQCPSCSILVLELLG